MNQLIDGERLISVQVEDPPYRRGAIAIDLNDAPPVLADIPVAIGCRADEPAFLDTPGMPFADIDRLLFGVEAGHIGQGPPHHAAGGVDGSTYFVSSSKLWVHNMYGPFPIKKWGARLMKDMQIEWIRKRAAQLLADFGNTEGGRELSRKTIEGQILEQDVDPKKWAWLLDEVLGG